MIDEGPGTRWSEPRREPAMRSYRRRYAAWLTSEVGYAIVEALEFDPVPVDCGRLIHVIHDLDRDGLATRHDQDRSGCGAFIDAWRCHSGPGDLHLVTRHVAKPAIGTDTELNFLPGAVGDCFPAVRPCDVNAEDQSGHARRRRIMGRSMNTMIVRQHVLEHVAMKEPVARALGNP